MKSRRQAWIFFFPVITLILVATYWKHISISTTKHPLNRELVHNLNSQIELTVRMTFLNEKIVYRFLCDFLRSATIFWKTSFGCIHIILDEKEQFDNGSLVMIQSIITNALPFRFRFTYEKQAEEALMENISRRIRKSKGYVTQLYSNFFLDLYTNTSIIAWCDTDIVFTMQILPQNIITKDGRLVVKGMNTFKTFPWLNDWDYTTILSLGLPMVADFMTFFPVYFYPRTIKNCRHFMLKKYGVSNFDAVYDVISKTHFSPVNILLSYAYYYERDLYDWHIDIGSVSLADYNKLRLPSDPLKLSDITPSLHFTVHTGYYFLSHEPLEQALCYLQISLNLTTHEICRNFTSQINYQLFEFTNDPPSNHIHSWCAGNKRKAMCETMIVNAYKTVLILHKGKRLTHNTSFIEIVEKIAIKKFNYRCEVVKYAPIS